MDTIDQLQRSLESGESLRTLVKTMKALSAVSIRQYERAVLALADYNRTVELGLQGVLRHAPASLFRSRADGRGVSQAAIVFGSDHGMCGRFNEDIAQLALDNGRTAPAERQLLAVGALPVPHLEQGGQRVEKELLTAASANGITGVVQNILLHIDGWREELQPLEIWVYYNRSEDGTGYTPCERQLYPIDGELLNRWRDSAWPTRQLPLFTMEREQLAGDLLQQYYFVTLFRACAESLASEHGNRLAAMQSAERNLDEHLDEVRQQYRRSRQAQITDELLDVVSGFEAVSGDHS